MRGSGNPANPIDAWRAEHGYFSRLLALVHQVPNVVAARRV